MAVWLQAKVRVCGLGLWLNNDEKERVIPANTKKVRHLFITASHTCSLSGAVCRRQGRRSV